LDPGTEVVSLDDTADIGTGLVLNSGNSPAQVTIDGSGRTIQLDGNTSGTLITVRAGVTLTLKNITFKGSANNNTALIRVDGGKLVLGDGAVITGNNTANYGGGVYVIDGTFNMTGGTISNNTAKKSGGVYVTDGTFTMSDGTISNNKAGVGGGVYLDFSSTFTMSGGTISGNKADYEDGGGVFIYSHATFTMSGGTISGNTAARDAGGVSVYNGALTKTTGTIYGNEVGPPLANTAGSGRGHAVYDYYGYRKRDTTAGPEVPLKTGDGTNWVSSL
jgi:hypothetical protein